jgi:signal transduction histidine kinase
MCAERSNTAHLLVVDDDPGLVRLVEKALRRAGHRTSSAATGAEAIGCLERDQPDLMLLDLKLPDAEGGQLIDLLEERGLRVPFVVITGQGDERVAVQMMKQGASDYLVKDADFLKFLPAIVERVLSKTEMEKALAARVLQQASVASLGKKVLEGATLESLLREAAQILAQTFEADFSEVLEVSADGSQLLLRAGAGWESGCIGKTTIDVTGTPAGLALKNLEPVVTRDIGEDPRFRIPELLASHKVTSSVSVPIYDRDRPYGILSVDTTSTRQFSEDDVHFLQSLANVLSQAIERRRAEKELLEVSGREQQRIGQDLHDGLGQCLTGIELMSHVLEEELSELGLSQAEQAARIAEHVRGAISQTRMLARGLFPVQLEEEGLMAALQELAASIETVFKIKCSFECKEPFLVKDNNRAIHLYRIAQEAINNAVKHGKARRISIILKRTRGRRTLLIEDNGKGFSPGATSSGMGLRIMKHRAAMVGAGLVIRPRKAGGVTVICTLDPTE